MSRDQLDVVTQEDIDEMRRGADRFRRDNWVMKAVELDVERERLKQRAKWETDHDDALSAIEWMGLITQYAAAGQFVEAAALCRAAEEAMRRARGDDDPRRLARTGPFTNIDDSEATRE